MSIIGKPLIILGLIGVTGLLVAFSVKATVDCGKGCCGAAAADPSCGAAAQGQSCPVAAKDTTAPASKSVTTPQTTCPVMGGPINKKIFVDYQGKRVYFCCSDCPAEFNKDPGKYVKKLEDAGVTLEKTPAAPDTK